MKNFNLTHSMTRFIAEVISIVLFFALAFLSKLSAQDTTSLNSKVHLDQIIVSEGKGAMTSGLDFVICMSKPNGVILGAQANNERANIRFGKSWENKEFGNFSAIVTLGAYKNVPWIGPMFLYNYKFIDLFSWSGVGMSTDNKLTDPGWNPNFFFTYEEAGLTFGKNRIAYAIQFFSINPLDHFLIYRRNIPLSKKHEFFIETTYYFNKDMPMFVLGYKYNFDKITN
jgi:hypothetical protein